MKKSFVLLSLIFFIALSLSAQVPVVVKGKKIDHPRNSKFVLPTTDNPVSKPIITRGGQCCLSIENATGYFVDIWVDEVYIARISPWNTAGACLVMDWDKWHAESVGGTVEWEGKGKCDGEFAIKIE